MKKKYSVILLVAITLIAFIGCSPNEADVFTAADTSAMFDKSAAESVNEAGGIYKIPVVLAGVPGGKAYSVTVVSEDGTAKKDIDFKIINPVLTFDDGFGIDTLRVEIIDNDDFEGDKTFHLSIVEDDVKVGKKRKVTVTIVDDEHPLSLILGSYAEADFKLADGSQDGGLWPVSISSIAGSLDQVLISNFWDGGEDIIAEVDLDAMTMAILPEQVIYVDGTYGKCVAVHIDVAESAYKPTLPIMCTIDENGNIEVAAWSPRVSAGSFANYIKTTLTKL